LTPEDVRCLTPLICNHGNSYDRLDINLISYLFPGTRFGMLLDSII